jgi:hypothetical protein
VGESEDGNHSTHPHIHPPVLSQNLEKIIWKKENLESKNLENKNVYGGTMASINA